MGRRNRPWRKRHKFTPLASQKKEGSALRGPLSALSPKFETVDWLRDLLPEHLWLAALANQVGLDHVADVYNGFMDAVDEHWPHDFVALGLISDFGLLPQTERYSFLEKNHALVADFFHRPLGRIMSLYPDSPASWLVQSALIEADGPVDPFVELGQLRRIVLELAPGKDNFAGRVRAVPLNRLLKHRKLSFASSLEVTKLMPRYPVGLSGEERFLVESMARSTLNLSIQQRKVADPLGWPKYFWRHNHDLLQCKPQEHGLVGGEPVAAADGEKLADLLRGNAVAALEYLDLLQNRLRPDLYDPRRDEVLFGLFARVTRLYIVMARDPFLWARDLSGIMLRSLADTAITFAYLSKVGTPEDFKRFIEYGEGQQKLLMLHLQDNYPSATSLDGLSSDEIAREFDLWPELLDVELGSWCKKDTRKLAQAAGFEDLYRLVFAPASNDLHGSWMSLKSSNLVRCAEPLHRWHRLPTFAEPPFFVNTAMAAQDLYERCRQVAIEALKYPEPLAKLKSLAL
jgi:hypothetical protein